MKLLKTAKVLLLTTTLFAAIATPAFAALPAPLSNSISATFQVTPPAPTYVLNWVDTNDNQTLKTTLPVQSVTAGATKDLKMRSTVSQDYSDVVFLFTITRTDGQEIDVGDVEFQEVVGGNLSGDVINGMSGDDKVLIYSNYYQTIAAPTTDVTYRVKFNKAGNYKIDAVATSAPG